VSSGVRHKSSAARTRRALNIPPHPSFLGSNAVAADRAARPTTDQIIYNPPSSAASVFHTPFKFLPQNDPRRRANLASELFAASTTIQYPSSSHSQSTQTTHPSEAQNHQQQEAAAGEGGEEGGDAHPFPSIEGAPRYRARHHLTKADIEEMRRLREADPVAHSVQSLSFRFQCSKLFVMMCCQAPREHKDKVKAELDKAQERWGPRRRAARDERRACMGLLFNGEI